MAETNCVPSFVLLFNTQDCLVLVIKWFRCLYGYELYYRGYELYIPVFIAT